MNDDSAQSAFWHPESDTDDSPRRTVAQILAEGIKSSTIKTLLRLRHSEPIGAWAFFDEFMPGIGMAQFGAGTRLDGWAMNVWPSNGYKTIAYEIKVSRSDFLRDIKDPGKRAWALTFTDEFYYVAPRHLISAKELPDDCGLIEVSKVTVKGSYRIGDDQFNVRATKKPENKRVWARRRDPNYQPTWDLLAAVARRSCRAESQRRQP